MCDRNQWTDTAFYVRNPECQGIATLKLHMIPAALWDRSMTSVHKILMRLCG